VALAVVFLPVTNKAFSGAEPYEASMYREHQQSEASHDEMVAGASVNVERDLFPQWLLGRRH